MSSPSRLLRGRPTAPLPTQYGSNSVNSLHKSELEEEETKSPSFSGQNKKSSTHRPSSCCCTSVDVDILSSGERVKDYLRSHRRFLEEFIIEELPQVTLEKIVVRKAQRRGSAADFTKESCHSETPEAHTKKLSTHADKEELIANLIKSIYNGISFRTILIQLCKPIADAIKADISELLLVESDKLVPVVSDSDAANTLSVDISIGCTVEGFVAATRQFVNIDDITKVRNDSEFPKGTNISQKAIASVLCIPIVQDNGGLLGVLTVGRKHTEPRFSSEDEDIAKFYLSWTSETLSLAQEHMLCHQQQKLNAIYKQIIMLMLEDKLDCAVFMQTLKDTVTDLVCADRLALFLVDSESKHLYAQIFTVSKQEEDLVTLEHLESTCFEDYMYLNKHKQTFNDVVSYKGHNMVFSIDEGVVGYAAKTKMVQNIANVRSCPHFCAEVDELTGYTTKSLLCVPIIANGRVLGVLEVINKKHGVFSVADEECLQSLAEFVGLVMANCQIKENLFKTENRLEVAQEILAYHRPCSDNHFQYVKGLSLSTEHQRLIKNVSVNTSELSLDVKARLAVTMFKDLVDIAHYQFDSDRLLRFSLTVAKNYRKEEYHNWDHAFSVAHCMYWILKGAPERFSDLERIALFWGCLCHDLDHRGHNNTFLVKTGAPLAKLYSSSVLENHHFSQALSLLQLEEHDIFSCLSSEQYRKVLTIMQKAILATDLVLFFGNKEKFSKIIKSGQFSWEVPEHKELVISLMMTSSDLCSSCKVWEDHKHSVEALFEEFHIQGDEEKAMGIKPLEMMDRDLKHKLPTCQVGFLKSVTCPCCELLVTVLPHVDSLLRNAQNNMKVWEKISEETPTD